MQTVADMRGVGVKNRQKFADVLCGRPLIAKYSAILTCGTYNMTQWLEKVVAHNVSFVDVF